ncbi:MAG TPA: hypothetical protein VJK08_01800 [Patescibacteria group bacterium]|nr:hypothetical protein [Patescibacteria group bacterium]
MANERPPVVEQIVVVRHAHYHQTFLTEEGKAQSRRLGEQLNKIRKGDGKCHTWICFSSSEWRAVETSLYVAHCLDDPFFDLHTADELNGDNPTVTMESLAQYARRCSSMLFVVHSNNVVKVMWGVMKQFGFNPETPWPWHGEWNAVYPTQGAVINMKTGEVSEISGYAA